MLVALPTVPKLICASNNEDKQDDRLTTPLGTNKGLPIEI